MFSKIQDEYTNALDNLVPVLRDSYETMKKSCCSDGNFDYSQAIVTRLRAFYCSQSKLKKFLGKKVAQAGSDFFVETIIFFLKLFNDVESLGFEIESERPIRRKRSAARPDITIWRGSELVAAIECKTQLGWHRDRWAAHFQDREHKIRAEFPNAQIFLVVMTDANWSGFGEDPRVGKQLFCLLKDKTWPTQLPKEYSEIILGDRIEELFKQLLFNTSTSREHLSRELLSTSRIKVSEGIISHAINDAS